MIQTIVDRDPESLSEAIRIVDHRRRPGGGSLSLILRIAEDGTFSWEDINLKPAEPTLRLGPDKRGALSDVMSAYRQAEAQTFALRSQYETARGHLDRTADSIVNVAIKLATGAAAHA